MAPKRKAAQAGLATAPAAPASKKDGKQILETAAATRPKRARAENPAPVPTKAGKKAAPAKPTRNAPTASAPETSKVTKATKGGKSKGRPKASVVAHRKMSTVSVEIYKDGQPNGVKEAAGTAEAEQDGDEDGDGMSFWLMKAEPEPRLENGHDVSFSIDDLAAKATPEAWDGVRNATARNNMRAMMKGDLAFFYHSSCKVPGIAGIMEIVQEHSVDESVFDKNHPYYDEKSTRDNPKWCVVHVKFVLKFHELVKLKDLQKYSQPGGVLANLQTLRQSRLSVSKVSEKEWKFILKLAGVDEDELATTIAGKQANGVDGGPDASEVTTEIEDQVAGLAKTGDGTQG